MILCLFSGYRKDSEDRVFYYNGKKRRKTLKQNSDEENMKMKPEIRNDESMMTDLPPW